MIKKFEFEFEDLSSRNSISFDYNGEVEEKMSVLCENDVPVIYVNRQALLLLAKTFIKMALGEYPTGFHVHLSQNLDADQPEAMRIVLNN
ncbi:MAG TPA: hypothetical protein VFV58_35480 [Blastocatellia bacterium]|nr:hypothetical protein [Blastocatellia bacterium]